MKFNDPNRDPRSVRNAATELSTEAPLGDHLSNDDEQTPGHLRELSEFGQWKHFDLSDQGCGIGLCLAAWES